MDDGLSISRQETADAVWVHPRSASAPPAGPIRLQPLAMAEMARRMTLESGAKADDAADPSEWIVAIAQDQCRASFALLFARFAPRVKSYLLRLGSGHELAEELAQETLLTVWRKAPYFDPTRASASTWIFTIARNLRIDAARRERHPQDLENEPELLPPAEASAEERISLGEREARVRQAMQTLSQEQAEVIRLSFFQDKAHGEISHVLGLPLGTVKSRLRLAMIRLRGQLDDLL